MVVITAVTVKHIPSPAILFRTKNKSLLINSFPKKYPYMKSNHADSKCEGEAPCCSSCSGEGEREREGVLAPAYFDDFEGDDTEEWNVPPYGKTDGSSIGMLGGRLMP